jgi:uncharacterized protein YebE (UPF0316 family)
VTLTSLLVVLTLFAYACGFGVGVLVTHAWHRNRDGEESLP